MSYMLKTTRANQILAAMRERYDIYAPKRFPKQGRYSDTDIVRYDRIGSVEEIVYDQKSDFPAKEVLTPICRAVMYFTEDEYRASKTGAKPILIFMRPCDINAMRRQEEIYLTNGGIADYYYARMRERVRVALIECREGWDTCFCVSMGSNQAHDYAMAIRFTDGGFLVDAGSEFAPYFEGADRVAFKPEFIAENSLNVTIPEIESRDLLLKLKSHPFWDEYNARCISCGACTVACSTCTCFSTRDVIYGDNPEVGERRRVSSSCQVEGFDEMAGGIQFRRSAASRMRYKVLHKFHDYKRRFHHYHMCVGCGRCTDRCPEFISITATLGKMAKAADELKRGERNE